MLIGRMSGAYAGTLCAFTVPVVLWTRTACWGWYQKGGLGSGWTTTRLPVARYDS
jgi:hypothetical protein